MVDTGLCLSCNAEDVEINDDENCDDCAMEADNKEVPPFGTGADDEDGE